MKKHLGHIAEAGIHLTRLKRSGASTCQTGNSITFGVGLAGLFFKSEQESKDPNFNRHNTR